MYFLRFVFYLSSAVVQQQPSDESLVLHVTCLAEIADYSGNMAEMCTTIRCSCKHSVSSSDLDVSGRL